MSLLQHEGLAAQDTIARLALDDISYCAGRRCVEAVRIADDIQSHNVGAPDRVRMQVHMQVGKRCLTCTEASVEPIGSDIDKEQIEAILEGRTY